LLLAPDTPELRQIAALLANALVCDGADPGEPIVEESFGHLWRPRGLPDVCDDPRTCRAAPECTSRVLLHQLAWADNAAAVDSALAAAPNVYAAALVFDPVDTLSYTLRMNHTDLPPTNRHFSDVQLGRLQVMGMPDSDWKKYFFAANLQVAVDRSLTALRLGWAKDGPLAVQVKVSFFAFGWRMALP
jgi:hypothetical protein